jgi:chromosome segregation ATPase
METTLVTHPTLIFNGLLALVGVLLGLVGWQYRDWRAAQDEQHREISARIKQTEADMGALNRDYLGIKDVLNGHMLELKTRLVRIETKLEDIPDMRDQLNDAARRITRVEASLHLGS